MHVVTLDTEQAAIIRAAAEAGYTILNARIERADPEKIISNSLALQRTKLDQINLQLDQGPLARWHDIPTDAQERILRIARGLVDGNDPRMREAAFEAMKGELLAHHSPGGLERNQVFR